MKIIYIVLLLILFACGKKQNIYPVYTTQITQVVEHVNTQDIVGIIDPCGDAPSIYDEVILKLNDGTLLASFSDNVNGYNTRFAILKPGSYITTDGSNCHFTVTSTNQVTY